MLWPLVLFLSYTRGATVWAKVVLHIAFKILQYTAIASREGVHTLRTAHPIKCKPWALLEIWGHDPSEVECEHHKL